VACVYIAAAWIFPALSNSIYLGPAVDLMSMMKFYSGQYRYPLTEELSQSGYFIRRTI
jgi:hypothetical protein